MRPIRAFLFAQGENGQWGCQVFREFEPLSEAVIAANGGKQHPVGVHIGFERPETEAVMRLLSAQENLVYLSSGAVGTMPQPIKASNVQIGSIGDLGFYPAINGFGYQLELTEADQVVAQQPNISTTIFKDMGPRGWVSSLSKHEPELFAKLFRAGIWDDDSYQTLEADLDIESRLLAGLRRYDILEATSQTPLLDHLKSTPPWILDSPISLLNLTVRSANVCAANEINKIVDFSRFGFKGLNRLPNLGQKSVNEISEAIFHLFKTGQPLKIGDAKPDWTIPSRLEIEQTESKGNLTSPVDLSGENSEVGFFSSINISDGLIKAVQKLAQSERGLWASRVGFRCDSMSLQQIADQTGLTRERVRQIEVKVYRKITSHPFWDELSRKVLRHLEGRNSPLFLNGLSAIDPWFEGAEELAYTLLQVGNHIPRLGFHILTWNDSPVVSRLNQTQWKEAIEEAKGILMAIAGQNLSEGDALSQAAGVLIGKGEDMREALQDEVTKLCIWSPRPDGSRILTGFGKSLAAVVSALLQESDTPLHVDEILKRTRANSTYEAINVPYIRGTLAEVGILYGRGTYGLMKHCPLNAQQMLSIRAEAEDIISGGLSSKQWHSSELFNELVNRGFSFEGKLTKYIINIALANSSSLVYLRRMIWGVRGEWNDSADARLDVKQAIVSLLENEGKPMTTAQIRSKLIEDRGLNIHFQIWASSPLVRIGPGVWGLEVRDVDMERAGATTYRLLKELSIRQEGMHVSEVVAFLGLSSEDEVSMLASIGNKDGLRMDKGQYCYLQPWGESRRISVWEAATSTLKAHPQGLPRGELHMYVDRMVKRKVDRQQLSGILQNIDAVYDPTSSLWKFEGPVGGENDIDEAIESL